MFFYMHGVANKCGYVDIYLHISWHSSLSLCVYTKLHLLYTLYSTVPTDKHELHLSFTHCDVSVQTWFLSLITFSSRCAYCQRVYLFTAYINFSHACSSSIKQAYCSASIKQAAYCSANNIPMFYVRISRFQCWFSNTWLSYINYLDHCLHISIRIHTV